MVRTLKDFAVSRRGNVTITAALFIPILVGMTVFNMELISYDRGQTRMHQAQMAGVLAASKEGQPEDGPATNLQAIVDAYIAVYMGALGTEEQWHFANISSPLAGVDGDGGYAVTAAADYDSWFSPLGEMILPPVRQMVRTENYYRKMETVLILDASMSIILESIGTLTPLDAIRQGCIDYVDSALQKEGHRISLLSYSDTTSLNLKYKDKLIRSESRRWKDRYPFLQEVADEYGWGDTDDLLHESGPEGYRQGIAVNRPDIMAKFGGNTTAYVASVEQPPASKEDGFDLLMSVGGNRPRTNTSTAYDAEAYAVVHFTCYLRGDGYSIPPEAGLQIPSSDKDLFPEQGFEWSRHYVDRCAMVHYASGPMPMIAHSNDREELLNNLQFYKACSSTGSDEGIMWALRLLSPNWVDIWEVTDEDGEPVPAPYHGKVDKRIVLITDGRDDIGYYSTKENTYPANKNIFPDLGEHIRKCGIDFYYVYFTLKASSSVLEITAQYLVDMNDPDHCVNFPASGEAAVQAIREFLTKLSQRQYRIRLAG